MPGSCSATEFVVLSDSGPTLIQTSNYSRDEVELNRTLIKLARSTERIFGPLCCMFESERVYFEFLSFKFLHFKPNITEEAITVSMKVFLLVILPGIMCPFSFYNLCWCYETEGTQGYSFCL